MASASVYCKELGYPKMRTVEDYENVLKPYKEKHPTIDGKPTIGLTLDADDWHSNFRNEPSISKQQALRMTANITSIQRHMKHVLHYRRPEEKEYFRWLNHMYSYWFVGSGNLCTKNDQYKCKNCNWPCSRLD